MSVPALGLTRRNRTPKGIWSGRRALTAAAGVPARPAIAGHGAGVLARLATGVLARCHTGVPIAGPRAGLRMRVATRSVRELVLAEGSDASLRQDQFRLRRRPGSRGGVVFLALHPISSWRSGWRRAAGEATEAMKWEVSESERIRDGQGINNKNTFPSQTRFSTKCEPASVRCERPRRGAPRPVGQVSERAATANRRGRGPAGCGRAAQASLGDSARPEAGCGSGREVAVPALRPPESMSAPGAVGTPARLAGRARGL